MTSRVACCTRAAQGVRWTATARSCRAGERGHGQAQAGAGIRAVGVDWAVSASSGLQRPHRQTPGRSCAGSPALSSARARRQEAGTPGWGAPLVPDLGDRPRLAHKRKQSSRDSSGSQCRGDAGGHGGHKVSKCPQVCDLLQVPKGWSSSSTNK